jgi:hypothetical protein
MSEQHVGGQPALAILRRGWMSLADFSRALGIHPDTIRSAARKARERQESWVRKGPDTRAGNGKDIWWINTDSPGCQELVTQWGERVTRLRAHTSNIPLTRRARSWEDAAGLRAQLASGQLRLFTSYLASQGLEIYVNVLCVEQVGRWKWRWDDAHGDGYGSQEEALIAALHHRLR